MKVQIQRVPRRPNWPVTPVVVTGVWLAVVLGGAFWGVWQRHNVCLCPFKRVTGLPCPGCGATRAAVSLLQGDLSGAVAWNPLAMAALGVFVAVAALRVGAGRKVQVQLGPAQRKAALAGMVGLFLANWIYVLLYVG
jgi:hypothetical protein